MIKAKGTIKAKGRLNSEGTNGWTYPHHVMETKVAQRAGLMLRALVQISVSDDGAGSVHGILLILHLQGKGRRNNMALEGHETLPNFGTKSNNSYLAHLWTNGQTTGAFALRLNVGGVLPLLGGMRGLGRRTPLRLSRQRPS